MRHGQQVTKRHIEGHGYQCLISGETMSIVIPFAYRGADGKVKRGHIVERVTDLRDAYIKMGY